MNSDLTYNIAEERLLAKLIAWRVAQASADAIRVGGAGPYRLDEMPDVL